MGVMEIYNSLNVKTLPSLFVLRLSIVAQISQILFTTDFSRSLVEYY